MDHLLRAKAPISDAGWGEIEAEATRTLRHFLAARKLVNYAADGGWVQSAQCIGRVSAVASSDPAVQINKRVVQPLAELRVPFVIDRRELEALDRGASDFDTQPIIDAARSGALAEDHAVFAGNPELGITGLGEVTPHEIITLDEGFDGFPDSVAKAVDLLQEFGIDGPYGIAMGPRCWKGVMESSESGGYPLIKHLRLMLDGPVVWAPALAGALIVSQRGGDFEIIGGQDWSIGYLDHDRDTVTLYLEETVTSLVNTPEASIRFDFPR